jgi:prevent-host-death family protein
MAPYPRADHVRSRYTTFVTEIPLRDLRAATSAVLRRVEAGESLVVTVDRRPVAALVPLERRPPWVPAERVWGRIRAAAADAGLAAELDELLPDRVADL